MTSALISAATRLAPTVGAEPAKRKRKADDAVGRPRRETVGTVSRRDGLHIVIVESLRHINIRAAYRPPMSPRGQKYLAITLR